MQQIASAEYGTARQPYKAQPHFFPLIAAVIDGSQNGTILVDDRSDPSQFLVIHDFGFSQIFGTSQSRFEAEIADTILRRREFAVEKIRLYAPNAPASLLVDAAAPLIAERQRFRIPSETLPSPASTRHCDILHGDIGQIAAIESAFGCTTRFWRTPEDFIRFSLPKIAMVDGRMAAICYAAAIADRRAEIDVITREPYRRQGVGHDVVLGFIKACMDAGIEPVWDCFTNNLGSVRTALSVGFRPFGSAYTFLTVPRR